MRVASQHQSSMRVSAGETVRRAPSEARVAARPHGPTGAVSRGDRRRAYASGAPLWTSPSRYSAKRDQDAPGERHNANAPCHGAPAAKPPLIPLRQRTRRLIPDPRPRFDRNATHRGHATAHHKQINFTIIPEEQTSEPRTYANFCSIAHTPFDFTLTFCEVMPLSEKEVHEAAQDHVVRAPCPGAHRRPGAVHPEPRRRAAGTPPCVPGQLLECRVETEPTRGALMKSAKDDERIIDTLAEQHPNADTELHYRNAFELLVATILSAQSTDERVNMVTPALFQRYPDPRALAAATPSELERQILSTGFFRQKSKALIGMAHTSSSNMRGGAGQHGALTTLPGVGRKTANVVLGHALGVPGLPVDRHVLRVANRIGIAEVTTRTGRERSCARHYPTQSGRSPPTCRFSTGAASAAPNRCAISARSGPTATITGSWCRASRTRRCRRRPWRGRVAKRA